MKIIAKNDDLLHHVSRLAIVDSHLDFLQLTRYNHGLFFALDKGFDVQEFIDELNETVNGQINGQETVISINGEPTRFLMVGYNSSNIGAFIGLKYGDYIISSFSHDTYPDTEELINDTTVLLNNLNDGAYDVISNVFNSAMALYDRFSSYKKHQQYRGKYLGYIIDIGVLITGSVMVFNFFL